jgi:hypothetical protein
MRRESSVDESLCESELVIVSVRDICSKGWIAMRIENLFERF